MGTRKAAYKQAPFSIKAAADLRDKEGFGYELDAVGDAILATAADADGIILNGANDNEWISVAPAGCGLQVDVMCGGTLAVGDELTSDANGAIIATTTSTDKVIGYATKVGASGYRSSALLSGAERRYQ